MLDPIVMLTPLVILAVVLLLGFAGCRFDPSAPAGPNLSIRVQVPVALTVTEIIFRWVPPGGQLAREEVPNPTPSSTEDGNNIFLRTLGSPVEGAWETGCQVAVSEDGAQDQDAATGNLILDGTVDFPKARFLASGTPSGGDFDVVFVGQA